MLGCCASRPQAGQSPYRHDPTLANQVDASSRHITAGSNPDSASSQPATSGAAVAAPNVTLKSIPRSARAKLPAPTQATSLHNPGPWTRERLARERDDWWDTRTEGNRHIWQTYQQAVKFAQEGDIKNAQALIDAAECTCPTGELWRRIYDNVGVEYSVSRAKWVVLEPEGIVSDEDAAREMKERSTAARTGSTNDGGSAAGGTPDLSSPISPVQSQTSTPGTNMRVFCRMSDTSKDILIKAFPNPRVVDIISHLQHMEGYANKRLRVAYLGHEHDADEPLSNFYREGDRLTVLVLPQI
ncbi:hypothetical protein BU24DRAFT_458463 [Aaosphaeria arxii CBS 175.79]|uniref:DC-UbP/UBTD2 N-terminal domain-containing protein n=1 Tax=Aaosphaeria arxii CBS 175.79 TaxID=1450172 RepID=A0A6A5Y1C4_9PLEO|nr:uncharacterized protein BU24DRAFT_458463 [Aaosphaeria arxii CBS 175.79]KAF2018721.1 hypothetical protein BU24DRAFT_458463 [Aaosphaeria arxii CBS 175.79]